MNTNALIVTQENIEKCGGLYVGNGRYSSKKQDEYADSVVEGVFKRVHKGKGTAQEEAWLDMVRPLYELLRWGVLDEGTVSNIISVGKKNKMNPSGFMNHFLSLDVE